MRLISLLLFLAPLLAQANVNEIFSDLLGKPDRGGFKGAYEIQQYETKNLKGGRGKLGLREHSAQMSVPLNSLSDRRWKFLANADGEEIRSEARFPNGRPIPNKLWNIGAGLSYMRMTDSDRTVGGSFLVGSNSDRPFTAARDLAFTGNFVYKVPTENESAWIFLVNLSNERGYLNYIPIPGAAYFFKASERLRMAVGIPFVLLFWSPFDKSVLSFSYFPISNAQAKFSYFFFGPAHVFAQVKYQSKNYRISDRSDAKERIFYEEAVGAVGISTPLERNVLVEGSVSYSFDRKYFLGEKVTDRKNGQILLPEKTPFASVKIVATF